MTPDAAACRDVVLVVGPPRTASTTVARVLWNHPSIDFYCHEPYENRYFGIGPSDSAATSLRNPICLADLLPGKRTVAPADGGLLIKEMSFQVGDAFENLASLTDKPIVFLVRDPRLTIASRMRLIKHYHGSAAFDPRETGWTDLEVQIDRCREVGIPYVLVDATDLRSRPEAAFAKLFARLGMTFSPDQLRWSPVTNLDLGRLAPNDRFYERVLASTGIEPPSEEIPAVDDFPTDRGLREHAREAVDIYNRLLEDKHRVGPA
jgi:hypothetical protein